MRVLHIFNEIRFSGAEIMYAGAAGHFLTRGYSLVAFNTADIKGSYSEQFEKSGIVVYHNPLPNLLWNILPFFKYFRDVYRFLKTENISVLHIHRAQYYWMFAFCGKLAHVTTVRTVHNVFKNKLITWPTAVINRWSARVLLGCIFQSISKSVYQNELNYYKNPSILVNNWYDSQKFFPKRDKLEKQTIRKTLGLPQDSFVIISTGTCTTVKNHEDIIRATKNVSATINCIYIHLGTGELENWEKKFCKACGIEDVVWFMGNKLNVRDYLIASDLYVMTSKFEGLGNAAIEAMACKTPTILYDSPGLRDLIYQNDNGFLIECDYTELSNKIIIYYENPEIADDKATQAFKHVQENYYMTKCVDNIINSCYVHNRIDR